MNTITTSIVDALEEARALLAREGDDTLRRHEWLHRKPSDYTFNVKYYGGERSGWPAVADRVFDDLTRHGGYTLYLHYPFCRYLCRFCHYAVKVSPAHAPAGDAPWLGRLVQNLGMLQSKIEHLGNCGVTSAYLGGGTPSLLAPTTLRQLTGLVGGLAGKRRFEFTVESTPDSITPATAAALADAGFTRVSTGVQVLDDERLKYFGRGHRSVQALAAVDTLLRETVTVNVDLMYALPGVAAEKFLDDVLRIAEMRPHSITLYRLRLGRSDERTAALMSEYRRDPTQFPDQREVLIQIVAARRLLAALGYSEGPLGWFSLPGGESQCYRDRWLRQVPLIGAGMGAYSYGSSWQWANQRDLDEWSGNVDQGLLPVASAVVLSPEEAEFRRAALRLRYDGRLPLAGASAGLWRSAVALVEGGLALRVGEEAILNELGSAFVDEIIDYFFQRGNSAVPQ